MATYRVTISVQAEGRPMPAGHSKDFQGIRIALGDQEYLTQTPFTHTFEGVRDGKYPLKIVAMDVDNQPVGDAISTDLEVGFAGTFPFPEQMTVIIDPEVKHG